MAGKLETSNCQLLLMAKLSVISSSRRRSHHSLWRGESLQCRGSSDRGAKCLSDTLARFVIVTAWLSHAIITRHFVEANAQLMPKRVSRVQGQRDQVKKGKRWEVRGFLPVSWESKSDAGQVCT